jgi:hypothetical protein
MKEPIISLEGEVRNKFPNQEISILQDEKRRKGEYKGWTRLQISCSGDLPSAQIATIMQERIQSTRDAHSRKIDGKVD